MPDLPPTIADFASHAGDLLEPGPHGYYAGGAGLEVTLGDNEAAWQRLALRPRMLVDVSSIDTSVQVLGERLAHPVIVAPTAFQKVAHPEGEPATARGAHEAGAVFTLSSLATTGIGELAAAVPHAQRWFQLYVWKDRGVVREMVAAAREHGYRALVVTVDLPVFGIRYRDLRSGFVVGDAAAIPNVSAAGGAGAVTPAQAAELIDKSLSWRDIEAFVSDCGLPVVVKGILTPEDARLAADAGAAAVVVSNHGGRQLDTVLSGADALPPIVDEVGSEIEVLVDGGIRSGTDVAKALALGARAVMVGRPVVWGLACGGAAGVARVLTLLRDELVTALMLLGCPRAEELGPSHVQRAPWA